MASFKTTRARLGAETTPLIEKANRAEGWLPGVGFSRRLRTQFTVGYAASAKVAVTFADARRVVTTLVTLRRVMLTILCP